MKNLLSLEGKTAVVTGGGKGIGKSVALGLAGAGANVVPVSRTLSDIQKVVSSIKKMGKKSIELAIDVTQLNQVEMLCEKVVSEFGAIDILVNCAGTHVKKPFFETSEDEWDLVLKTNLTSIYLTCKVIGKKMAEQKKGKIINIASLGGIVGIPNASAYCASKGGVILLTKVLAVELAKHNIMVNAIAPGFFDTDMTRPIFQNREVLDRTLSKIPLQRLGNSEEIIGATVLLSSDGSDYITGTVLVVDGGVTAGTQ